MPKLFISHSSKDDAFVRELRAMLTDHGEAGWIDSRELRGGAPSWTDIRKAIEEASGYAVVVSPEALQSKWIGKELCYALKIRDQGGKERFPIIPLSLDGTRLGVLEAFFGDEPLYVPVASGAGGVDAAMNAILVAMGRQAAADVVAVPQPRAQPMEDLVLELTDLRFHERDGNRRVSARAQLVYQPAIPGQPEVTSTQPWRLVVPLAPLEAGELTWYLETYPTQPSASLRERAKKVEANLLKWGRALHEVAMPVAYTANVMKVWARIDGAAQRRFSVEIDAVLETGASGAAAKLAEEAASELFAVPWELLHDGDGYLFQGANPTRVRRRLPNSQLLDVPVVATPIRILLITARPQDDVCSYIDPGANALVDATEALPGLVQVHVLGPPTLPELRAELDRARAEQKPYHVVHFDGRAVYDRTVGSGGLCFELPEDAGQREGRRHATVFTGELGPLLHDHRIPLVFLEGCQTAKAAQAVAAGLLKVGVASVVAMSHCVLGTTARRFAAVFYRALAGGARIGDAMLAGQRDLKDDPSRGHVIGEGELRLEDWFVPVLFQQKDDPQLFEPTRAEAAGGT